MSNVILAVYLIIIGLITLLAVAIPGWLVGLLALIAGILLLVEPRIRW